MGKSSRVVAEKPTDQELERIAQATARMDHSERILFWDKRQATYPELNPEAILCSNDPSHGAMQMQGSGALLICQSRKGPGVYCTATHPVSL